LATAADNSAFAIAVIGLSARLPGSRNLDEFWQNLQQGRECVSFFTDDELLAAGVSPEFLADPNYVKAKAVINGIEMFDASFFDYSPREAQLIDPQQRLFLECAWEAFEHAGYNVAACHEPIGVYAGAGLNTYFLNLLASSAAQEIAGGFQTLISNDKDFLTTRASYKLNLSGPSVTVQTACSTSLVAVHLACRALLYHECDMALAGGVSVGVPQKSGYLYEAGSVGASDGHCRAFDARASGTVNGDGVAVVVLKRLTDALVDRDCIHAVIRGTSVNNDGSAKIGYTAPGVDGQSQVVAAALAIAGIDPESVTYIEAHGTGTRLGDPIEIEALSRVFKARTNRRGFCSIGSVKTNIGHLGAAAGAAGLIKTILCLKHKEIPPSLHYETPNPQIDFEDSPFVVSTSLKPWATNGGPRIAGINSLGLGGTNAHIILEEAPRREGSSQSRPYHLFNLSARTPQALATAASNLADHLQAAAEVPNASDVAYTLQVGRKGFEHRLAVVCADNAEAISKLRSGDADSVAVGAARPMAPGVAFLFPGIGDHYIDMALGIYQHEPTFRKEMDHCCELLAAHLSLDLRDYLYPRGGTSHQTNTHPSFDLRGMLGRRERAVDHECGELDRTVLAQSSVFAVGYALAKLLNEWGVQPEVMMGYSIGEYVAACLADVFSLEDAILLIASRSIMIDRLPEGAMLAVAMPSRELEAMLGTDLWISAVNGPSMCVVSGPKDAVARFERELQGIGLPHRRLPVRHAFHSPIMEPAATQLLSLLKQMELRPPKIPFVSNLTGTWIREQEACDPGYWASHLHQPVRFGEGLQEVWKEAGRVLLDIGPGQALSSLARMHPEKPSESLVVPCTRHSYQSQADLAMLLGAVGKLWVAGVELNWRGFYANEKRLRVPLPTYPFEKQRYWIDQPARAHQPTRADGFFGKQVNIENWFYLPAWKPAVVGDRSGTVTCWMVLADEEGLGENIANLLENENQRVIRVRPGAAVVQTGHSLYSINPSSREDYDRLLRTIRADGAVPDVILHFWTISSPPPLERPAESFHEHQVRGYYSLLFLAQALEQAEIKGTVRLSIVSNYLQTVSPGDETIPEKATLLGASKVISQEYRNLICQSIDVGAPGAGLRAADRVVKQLLAELTSRVSDLEVAYRGRHRLVKWFSPVEFSSPDIPSAGLRRSGVYVLIGGLGRLGLLLADHLSRTVNAKVALVGRTPLPDRSQWTGWLRTRQSDERKSRVITRLIELEESGADFITLTADAATEDQMGNALDAVERRYGGIDGVLHLAAVTSGDSIFRPAAVMGRVQSELQFRPKAHALYVLEKLLRDRKPDFVLLFSSMASVLGGLGLVAYSAANAFVDAFAEKASNQGGQRWISANWEAWLAGGSVAMPASRGSLQSYAMTPREGVEAFSRVVARAEGGQVIVAAGDLEARLRSWVNKETVLPISAPTGDRSSHPVRTAYVAPSDDIERCVTAIWEEMLGIEKIGVDDNFFELGGHSLLAGQLLSRLGRALETEIPIRALFEASTVASLSAYLRGRLEAPLNGSPVPVPRTQRAGGFPLSLAQYRLWFIDHLEGGGVAYVSPAAIRLSGRLQTSALRDAFNEIIRRHEVLRTTYESADDGPVQVVGPARQAEIRIVDLTSFEPAEHPPLIRTMLADESRSPFDLEAGPPVRPLLLRLSPQDNVLSITVHHIATDGWSAGILVRELSSLYDVFCNGAPSKLQELKIQYGDFAIWQHSWVGGDLLAQQLQYWKNNLNDIKVVELPTDRPRPAVQTYRGGRAMLRLSQGMAHSLRSLARQSECTLFMLLLAALNILIFRYTGLSDIVIGVPVAGRNLAELEELIGFFVNTLALRTRLTELMRFGDLIARIKQTALAAYANQDVPFERLVEELGLARDLSHTPIVQVMLALQNTPREPLELSGLQLADVPVDNETAKFDLTLAAAETPAGLFFEFEYNSDLFDRISIERMAGHLNQALARISARPDNVISGIEFLTEPEIAQMREWNDTAHMQTGAAFLHRLIEQQVRKHPDAVSLSCGEVVVTYSEMNRRANQLAHYLSARGLHSGQLVGALLERSIEMVLGLLAVWKARGAYVPLDPLNPKGRLEHIIGEAETGLILTQRHLLPSLAGQQEPPICVDSDWVWAGSAEDVEADPLPDGPAYVIYTSGSTGEPKGVMNTHKGIHNRITWMQQRYDLGVSDRVLQKTPYSFDVSLWELFWPLLAGSELVIAKPGGHRETSYLVDLICERRITTVHFVPSMLAAFLNEAGASTCKSLTRVISSGEALPFGLKQEFYSKLDAQLHNLYGPTEVAVDVTSWSCSSVTKTDIVPIGRPLWNTEIRVVDACGDQAPINVSGELLISGVGLACGYLKRPELTAVSFVPHPCPPGPGARIYRSGDLARYLPNGELEFLGRSDDQVKIRGYRIELGEIEAILARHPEVRQAAVVASAAGNNGRELIGYVLPVDPGRFSPAALRAHLQARLPDYMIPSALLAIESFPLTAHGKVDRAKLPAFDRNGLDQRAHHVEARDLTELQLALIWESVLGLGPIGVTDDFLSLGGHSITAVILMSRIQEAFGRRLEVSTLLQHGTIENIAATLRSRPRPELWSSLVAIQKSGKQQPLFCVHPVGGNVLCYAGLARALGSEQPVYGFQAEGLAPGRAPRTTVEEMGAAYITLMRTVQGQGPYHLGGWSFGGLVAFEMARQLKALGEEVGLLAIFDAIGSVVGPISQTDRVSELRGFCVEMGLSIGDSSSGWQRSLVGDDADTLAAVLEKAKQERVVIADAGLEQFRQLYGVFMANRLAMSRYRPQPSDLRITLFVAEGEKRRDPWLGWKTIAKEVEVHKVPGSHRTILKGSNAEVLAEMLASRLDYVR
jgi:amino acid adenylation domain-containing protein